MIRLFHPFITKEACDAVTKTLQSGWIGLGPKTEEFEKEFAKYIGCKYAVAVNSATSALHLAMMVSDVKEGDEVITTPMTFISTNHVILYQKATPMFVDIDPKTMNMDLDQLEMAITPETKAVVVVHFAGNPVDMDRLYDIANKKGIYVIEDAAHACGASFRGKKIGNFGLTCFSFHAVKNLPLGDGGMVTTNDKSIYERLMKLRWLGIDKSTYSRSKVDSYKWEYDVAELGFKYHMNDISAAIGVEQLKYLDSGNKKRQEIVALYKENMPGVEFLKETPGAVSANHLCIIKIPNRDKIKEKLSAIGIETGIHYKPNNYYELYKDTKIFKDLRYTDMVFKTILSLPNHLHLSNRDVKFVAASLMELL